MVTGNYKQSSREESIAGEVIGELGKLASNRGTFEAHWQEIAERMLPAHSGNFQGGSNGAKGAKNTALIFDSTAAIALSRFGAILDSLLTPRNQTWHRLLPSDNNLLKDRATRLWFEDFNRILFKYRYAPRSNFASQNQLQYTSLGAYGTGALFIDKLAGRQERGIRYRNTFLGEIYLAENHQGLIDKALRKFRMTARQAVQWATDHNALEKLPQVIKDQAKKDGETEYEFIHCVKPRPESEFDPQRLDYRGMAIASYYVSVEGKVLLSEKGYRTFPYAASRYEQAANEVYGRSPAMQALPATKTLNEQKKTLLQQGQKALDPVLLAHDDGVIESFSLKPGAMNYGGVSADGRPLVHALPIGNIMVGKDLMDDERKDINDAMLVNLFQILTENPQMTATEVMERTREKGILLAPTIGRQQSEYQGPMIEREADLLMEQGLIPPMPPALVEAGGEYRIEYDSPLSRTQRAEEASGLMRTMETTLNAVNITGDKAPLDYFNWDEIIPALADIHGVPARWMNSVKRVEEIRAGRQEAMETQTAIQAAPAAAAIVKAGAAVQRR